MRFLLISAISFFSYLTLPGQIQKDTVYILYEYDLVACEKKTDSLAYPKDCHRREFTIPTEESDIVLPMSFSYLGVYPDWVDPLYYRFEPISTLQKRDYKDKAWFEANTYKKIVAEIGMGGKVLLLADKAQIRNDSICWIKVHYHHQQWE